MQSSCTLLEHFLKFIFYMLYTISKLRNSKIQCFKQCTIQSWNEGVTAITSKSLQAEGRFLHGYGISLLLREFHSHFAQCCGIPPEVSRYLLHIGSWTPQAESQLRSAAKSAFCCEVISQPLLCVYEISQPLLCVYEISQTSFSPAKWSLVLPDIYNRHFGIFFFIYFCMNFHSSPCNPPTIRFLS